ncbi:acylneuraminate cytidylyltransferase family protein [Alphaproteobacteria bacterium]|nr:acylneuraminate cytidylyltransferase family protein [Alphaproteobacteria bacterium]
MIKYRDKKILAVVPARGGSKGIKLKNLIKISGQSLIEIVANVIKECQIFTHAVVSTDHELIAQEAKRVGLGVPFMRPQNISGDRIGDHEVLKHALIASEEQFEITYDIIVMLQPTSPLRNKFEVKLTIDTLIDGNWDTVWTLSKTDLKYHPYKAITVKDDGQINLFSKQGNSIVARQQLTETYHRNGVAYAINRHILAQSDNLMSKKTGGVILTRKHISIDTMEDVLKIESQI